MTKTLCRPCMEKLKLTKTVKLIPSRARKETCAECGRRRYCNEYIT